MHNLNDHFLLIMPNGEPALIELPGERPPGSMARSKEAVAVYSTRDALERSAAEMGLTDYRVAKVPDHKRFTDWADSNNLRIALDPHLVGDGTQWIELGCDGAMLN